MYFLSSITLSCLLFVSTKCFDCINFIFFYFILYTNYCPYIHPEIQNLQIKSLLMLSSAICLHLKEAMATIWHDNTTCELVQVQKQNCILQHLVSKIIVNIGLARKLIYNLFALLSTHTCDSTTVSSSSSSLTRASSGYPSALTWSSLTTQVKKVQIGIIRYLPMHSNTHSCPTGSTP